MARYMKREPFISDAQLYMDYHTNDRNAAAAFAAAADGKNAAAAAFAAAADGKNAATADGKSAAATNGKNAAAAATTTAATTTAAATTAARHGNIYFQTPVYS